MYNLNLMAGQKFFCCHVQGPNLTCFYISKGCYREKSKLNNKKLWALWARLKSSAGHIWPSGHMLYVPGLSYDSTLVHCDEKAKEKAITLKTYEAFI